MYRRGEGKEHRNQPRSQHRTWYQRITEAERRFDAVGVDADGTEQNAKYIIGTPDLLFDGITERV